MNYACKKCGGEIDDIAEAMLHGCACGSRIFKKANLIETEQDVNEIERIKNSEESDISIMIQEKGVYAVNIKSLVNRESQTDPIFIQDTNGKINVVFNPDT